MPLISGFSPLILGVRRWSSDWCLVNSKVGSGGCIGSASTALARRSFGSSLPVGRLPLDPKEVIPDTSGLYSAAAAAPKEKKSQEERRSLAQSKTVAMPLLTFDALREVRATKLRVFHAFDSPRPFLGALHR